MIEETISPKDALAIGRVKQYLEDITHASKEGIDPQALPELIKEPLRRLSIADQIAGGGAFVSETPDPILFSPAHIEKVVKVKVPTTPKITTFFVTMNPSKLIEDPKKTEKPKDKSENPVERMTQAMYVFDIETIDGKESVVGTALITRKGTVGKEFQEPYIDTIRTTTKRKTTMDEAEDYHEEHRKKGLGTRRVLLIHAMCRGLFKAPLHSGLLTAAHPDMQRIWRILKLAGIAKITAATGEGGIEKYVIK